MDRKIITSALAMVISCLSFHTIAQDVIYRWVDENNVVHYSQHQPGHDNYTTLTISNRPATQPKPVQENKTELKAKSEQTEETSLDETLAERCTEATNNLKTLTEFERVQVTDAKGELKVLTETEKNQQIKLTKKQIEVYCK